METTGFGGLDVRVRKRDKAEMPPWCLVCTAAGAAVPLKGRWRRISYVVFMWALWWELIKNFVLDISGLRCRVGS